MALCFWGICLGCGNKATNGWLMVYIDKEEQWEEEEWTRWGHPFSLLLSIFHHPSAAETWKWQKKGEEEMKDEIKRRVFWLSNFFKNPNDLSIHFKSEELFFPFSRDLSVVWHSGICQRQADGDVINGHGRLQSSTLFRNSKSRYTPTPQHRPDINTSKPLHEAPNITARTRIKSKGSRQKPTPGKCWATKRR